MSNNLRYSAAQTSRINKRSSISPIKKRKNELKKLLPSQAKYQQNIKNKSKNNTLSPSPTIHSSGSTSPPLSNSSNSNSKDDNEKLVIEGYNVQLDFQLSKGDDILMAVDTILENRWAESTTLHTRFHSNETVTTNLSSDDLLFSLRGLSMEAKADIIKYRRAFLSEDLLTLNQLYSIYEQQGHTFVDRSLEVKIREGKLRKFIITNASPVVSKSPQKFQSGKITYGFENAEVVVKTENYLRKIRNDIDNREKILANYDEAGNKSDKAAIQLQVAGLTKYLKFVAENPTALFIGENEYIDKTELTSLVSLGYVTLTSNHLNEIEAHQYSVSYPNCGSFLKLINAGRSWLVKTLTKTKFKQILEESLFNKWEGTNSVSGTCKMSNFRKPFYGYDLNWILADSLGAGIVEVFNTPVGRGWQLTGKL